MTTSKETGRAGKRWARQGRGGQDSFETRQRPLTGVTISVADPFEETHGVAANLRWNNENERARVVFFFSPIHNYIAKRLIKHRQQ